MNSHIRFCFVAILLSSFLFAQDKEPVPEPQKKPIQGFIDLNFYPYDTRDATVFTINLLSSLPYGFQYFSFVNYGTPIPSSKNQDLENFYTEQNIYWNFPHELPFDLNSQWDIASGPNNDILRFGAGWKISQTPIIKAIFERMGLYYVIHFFPVQIDSLSGFNWQMEHYYAVPVFPTTLDKRVYLSGFADHNLGPNGSTWVAENQLGIRMIDRLYAVAEYRRNEFLTETDGVGFGVEYKIEFNAP